MDKGLSNDTQEMALESAESLKKSSDNNDIYEINVSNESGELIAERDDQ